MEGLKAEILKACSTLAACEDGRRWPHKKRKRTQAYIEREREYHKIYMRKYNALKKAWKIKERPVKISSGCSGCQSRQVIEICGATGRIIKKQEFCDYPQICFVLPKEKINSHLLKCHWYNKSTRKQIYISGIQEEAGKFYCGRKCLIEDLGSR